MLAYDYPAMGIFWSFVWFFIFFIWLMLLFRVISDVFRSHDLGGLAKTLWLIFVILVPFLGIFVYLIARGDKMAQHAAEAAQAQQAEFTSYVQQAAGSGGGSADELAKLAELKSSGVLTEEEFAQQKAKILG